MITSFDDYCIHQTHEPVAQPAQSDRNFYDRYWFNGFDPDGAFVRAFVPELAQVNGRAIFEPARHGVRGYPTPIVEHTLARARALDAFAAARA